MSSTFSLLKETSSRYRWRSTKETKCRSATFTNWCSNKAVVSIKYAPLLASHSATSERMSSMRAMVATQLAPTAVWHHLQWEIRFCRKQANASIRWKHEKGKVRRKSFPYRTEFRRMSMRSIKNLSVAAFTQSWTQCKQKRMTSARVGYRAEMCGFEEPWMWLTPLWIPGALTTTWPTMMTTSYTIDYSTRRTHAPQCDEDRTR